MFKKSSIPSISGGKIDNLLGSSTSFRGTLKSDGNLRVDGVYEGTIETAGNVIVGPSAKILADIVANGAQVWGIVRGNITVQGRLEILPTGRVWGDIRVGSLLIDEGGVFRGQCIMMGEDAEPLTLLEPGTTEGEDVFPIAEEEAPVALSGASQEAWYLSSLEKMHDAVAESVAQARQRE